MKALPNASPLGLWLVLFPLWLKYKLSGEHFLYPRIPPEGHETLAELVTVRTLHFDELIARAAPAMEQFVVLGAGYDTRAYGALAREGLRCFELDQAPTQSLKLSSLAKAGIDARHVTFVTVDFSREDTFQKLREAGYDPRKKTLFLWEGVTLYLSEEDVRKTMRAVHANAAPGSVLVADIYAQRMIDYASKGMARRSLELTDELPSFGLRLETHHQERLEDFVKSESLRLADARFLGARHKKGVYMAIADLRI